MPVGVDERPHRVGRPPPERLDDPLWYERRQIAVRPHPGAEDAPAETVWVYFGSEAGFIYYRQDKFVEAARWFDNAIRMDPSRAIAYLNLGEAHEKAGDAQRANKAYATYLELAPKGPAAEKLRERLGTR